MCSLFSLSLIPFFLCIASDEGSSIGGISVHAFEIMVVLSIMVVWGTVIVQFIHRWNEIHISNSVKSRVEPKNMENIKVGHNELKQINII